MTNFYRGRRTRATESLRHMARETVILPSDLIQPYFVIEGSNKFENVDSMPGVQRLTVDLLKKEIKSLEKSCVEKVILFGIPDQKDAQATSAWGKNNIVARAIAEIKSASPSVTVIADVCLCQYTDHGHCGHLVDGEVENDSTLETLSKVALSYAHAGADIIAPSDMMDGRVWAIRHALDEDGFIHTPILSYAAKYASSFYGPFREAAGSAPQKGDRKTYQMDPANADEAMREIAADIDEGADMVMVKPALSYLDVIRMAKERFSVPVFAYSVSGEYSMVKAMAKLGWGDEEKLALEILLSIKRAGAQQIITYFAKDVHRWIK